MQRRIWALLLCGVLLLGVLAGCGKKNGTGDTSGDKTVNGTETKNDADSQLPQNTSIRRSISSCP